MKIVSKRYVPSSALIERLTAFKTLSPIIKVPSARFLVCSNFQNVSMSLKAGENIFLMSNSLDPGETPSYSASHPDPSCLHMAL